MKKLRNRLIKSNEKELSLTENNMFQSLFQKNNILTDYSNTTSTSSNHIYGFNKTSTNFKKKTFSGFGNSHSNIPNFAKTSYDSKAFRKKVTFNIKQSDTVDNGLNSKIQKKSKQMFPYITLTKNGWKQTSNSLKSNELNDLKRNKTTEKINDRISNIRSIFSKNGIENGSLPKDIKKLDEKSKYKYSIILKNLDIWDKDHCDENKIDSNTQLFNLLLSYFEENKLEKEKSDLIYASNVMKTRQNEEYRIAEGKQDNKVIMDIIKRRKKETGTILKNNLYKTQLKFSELFDKKYTKAFDEDLDIDPDTFNLLLEDEIKYIFYNQIIKDRMKYEKQLHDDLLNINNLIFKRKNIKEEKTLRLKELYIELTKLKKEYNEKYTKNRKDFWLRYDSYEHYYKTLMSNNSNLKSTKELNKIGEIEDFIEHRDNLKVKTPYIEEKKQFFKSPSPKKRRRTSIVDKQNLSIYKNHIKRLEDEKKFKLLHMNHEMNSKLREIENFYGAKFDSITSEQKKIENDLKILKLELNYYKKINDELVREHKIYYMNKLKKGYDCRKEGLTWVVYNLLELQVPLEYHHFPKYLTHEHIDYLKKYAKMQLKQDELKIIINALKKKQNTQKMKDVLKMMDVIDNIIDVDGTTKLETKEENDFNNKEFIASKMKIDKKFLKIYQDNIDVMKNYLFKNVEHYEFHKVINEFKKDLYHGSNSDINKSKRDVLNVFMGDKNNKNFFTFLVDIKTNLERLEIEKEKLFEIQKKNFFKLVESNMNHKASINNVVKNEMIKRCLFGTRLEQ